MRFAQNVQLKGCFLRFLQPSAAHFGGFFLFVFFFAVFGGGRISRFLGAGERRFFGDPRAISRFLTRLHQAFFWFLGHFWVLFEGPKGVGVAWWRQIRALRALNQALRAWNQADSRAFLAFGQNGGFGEAIFGGLVGLRPG